MSDDEKNVIEDYGKDLGKEGIYQIINQTGDKILNTIKFTFRLKTSKKPLSIKRYKSGWRGNGFVKTYKISSLAKGTLGAVINFGEAAYDLFKHGLNSKEFAGSLGSSIGSIITGNAAGMAMGSFCPSIGNITGFIIGVGAATIGAIDGEYIGENLIDR